MRFTPELLSPVDAAWFRMEHLRSSADIGALMLLDGPVDDAALRTVLETRLLVHPRFHRRVTDTALGVTPPRWEEEADFSLDAHLEHRWVENESELARIVGELMSQPLDMRRSPWKVLVFDGPCPGLFTRVHHCMGDGFALVELLVSLADSTSGRPISTPPRPRHRLLRDARDAAAALGHLLLLSFDPPTCLRGVLSGERRVAWSPPIPLELVKRIAHARVGTVNDVLMGALSGALRRYMLDRDPCALRVRAIVPVNLRPEGTYDESHGNWFGLVFPELPLDIASADERLSAVEAEMQRIKESKEAVVALGILAALGRSPNVIDHIAQEIFARKATLVVTNVPGPRTKLRLAGRTVNDLWFWVPHPCGLAVGASIISYAGNVRVGIRTDAGVVPDPERIAALFAEELAAWC